MVDVLIRVDANKEIGAGHLMRCLALAQMLQAKGMNMVFLCCDLLDNFKHRLESEGFAIVQSNIAKGSQEDALFTIQYAQKSNVKYLVFDGYHFSHEYYARFQGYGGQIALIDDFGNVPPFVDIVINHNGWATELSYPATCKTFLGLAYLLLRKEFWPYLSWQRGNVPKRHLLITLGGTDPHQLTEKIIQLLARAQYSLPFDQISVVLGNSTALREDHLINQGRKLPINYYTDLKDFAALMATVDMAVTAGGVTCWELALMQIPSLVIIQAQNQEKVAQFISDHQLGVKLGWYFTLDENRLQQGIDAISKHPHLSKCHFTIGQQSFDMIEQLANKLSKIQLRHATEDDSQNLFLWRNSFEIRKWSVHQEELHYDQHLQWLQATLKRPDRILLIAENASSQAIGTLRFDLNQDSAELSIYLVPALIGQGLGEKLLALGEKWILEHQPQIKTLQAKVLSDNERSKRLFQKAGYTGYSQMLHKDLYE